MAKVNLVAPWEEYYHKMKAFFAEDDNVTILYDEGADDIKYIKVLVDNPEKAAALDVLLEKKKTFGSVTLIVIVVPTNSVMKDIERYMNQRADDLQYYDIYNSALLGNKNFAFIKQVIGMLGFDAIFVGDRDQPGCAWDKCKTVLADIQTAELHYVRVPENLVVIDFDLKDPATGEKSYERNLEAASKDYKRRYYELTATPVRY